MADSKIYISLMGILRGVLTHFYTIELVSVPFIISRSLGWVMIDSKMVYILMGMLRGGADSFLSSRNDTYIDRGTGEVLIHIYNIEPVYIYYFY